MNKQLFVFFATVLAAALLVAGCGSSDDNGTTASLSKAQFVKQGNAICRKGNAQIESEFEEFAEEHHLGKHEKPSKKVLAEATETVLIPAITTQIEGLRALGAPEGDEGEIDEILSGAEEALEEAEEDPAAFTEGEPTKFKQVNKKARAYGLTVCAEEGNE
ncbi:MAG TPA: hypothetical protein VFN89_02990 [Solirubrobacterales bacterium]|nr:hypothetical protein [Solirubrobacterales bacterium]